MAFALPVSEVHGADQSMSRNTWTNLKNFPRHLGQCCSEQSARGAGSHCDLDKLHCCIKKDSCQGQLVGKWSFFRFKQIFTCHMYIEFVSCHGYCQCGKF